MQFRILWDQPEACPYRDGQTACLPLRLPLERVQPETFDQLLEEGDRRTGRMLYRTNCPACNACQPLRVPVKRFVPSRSQRRVWKANPDVEVRVGRPALNRDRLTLYNRHKMERGLSTSGQPLSPENYRAWLNDSCVDTREFAYYVADRLIGVTIVDAGRHAASSVYHYFDPDESRRSLGTWSVLKELQWCQENGLDWYYLGFYVSDCSHLVYKASYYPHQRKENGQWVEYESADSAGKKVTGS
jgi:arginine-tRNA-protein transferase